MKIALLIIFLTISMLASQNLEKVKLQLQWKHQFEFAGFYAAKEKNFYKDVGLDVEFIEVKEKTDITNEVLSGNTQYGLTYASIIAEYLNGRPVVLIANFFKQSPLVLVTQEHIKSLLDLKGKRVMGLSDSIHNITLLNMLSIFNLTQEDIIDIPTSFNVDDFVNKKIDAMTVFTTNELYYLSQAGVKYNIFDPTVYGSKYYDVNLFTTKNELLNNPNRVKNMKEASVKGWEYALSHQDEIIELILKKYNTQNKSREALYFEAKQIELIMMAKLYKIGSIDINRIKTIADNFEQAGFIKKYNHEKLEQFIYDYQSGEKDELVNLTSMEKKYLKQKKSITMCINPDWMPFEKLQNGKYIGIAADYMKIIGKKINTPINIIQTATWSESLQKAKQRECDILSMAAQTNDRKEYMDFTSVYLETSTVIATKHNEIFIDNLENFTDKTWGVVKDYALSTSLKEKFPNINIVEFESIKDALKKVEKNELYGFLGSSIAVNQEIQSSFAGTVWITGRLDDKNKFSIATRNDEKILQNIFNKALDSIEQNTKNEILNKWVLRENANDIDYELWTKVLGLVVILVLFFAYRQHILKKYNTTLKTRIEEVTLEIQEKNHHLLQQSKMASMGEMIENIAHQWRQPLSQVNSSVLMIDGILYKEEFKNELVEKKLLEIESLTQYMSDTIDDFQNFLNPNKQKEYFSLQEVITNSLSILKASFESQNIQLQTNINKSPQYYGYPNELQQVIVVILNNAKDAFIGKQITNAQIMIEIKEFSQYYKISICDNAGGVDKEMLDKIFEPYFTTKHKSQGRGLGLYISKMIIEDAMMGMLSVENKNNGACFHVSLLKSVDNARF